MGVRWIVWLFLMLSAGAASETGFYTLVGAVGKPGHYPLDAGATLSQILVSHQVDLQVTSRVMVWRGFHDGRHSAWTKALRVGGQEAVTLEDGDLIVVPAQATSTAGFEAAILGEVTDQGKFILNSGASLLDLIVLGGGPTPKADLQSATLLRDGREFPISLAPHNVLGLSRLKICKGDIVYVSRGLRIGVSGEVIERGIYVVSRQSMDPLGELLESAGTTSSAALDRIQIVRPSLAKPIMVNSLARDLQLEDGDTVVVPALRCVVLGSVDKPGAIPLRGGETLGLIVAAAGASRGRLNEVNVIRSADVASGCDKREIYDLNDVAQAGVRINDGDVVFVPGEASDGYHYRPMNPIDFTDQRPGWLDLHPFRKGWP